MLETLTERPFDDLSVRSIDHSPFVELNPIWSRLPVSVTAADSASMPAPLSSSRNARSMYSSNGRPSAVFTGPRARQLISVRLGGVAVNGPILTFCPSSRRSVTLSADRP